MEGRERQVLTLVRELEPAADEKIIARHMGVSPEYARQLLQALVEERYIQLADGGYRVARKGDRRLNPWKGAVIASRRR